MKKLLMLLALCAGLQCLYAQDSTRRDKPAKSKAGKTLAKDYVTMKDGKVVLMKKSNPTDLTTDLTLDDGTTISANGTITLPNGSTKTLKEGEKYYLPKMKTKKPTTDSMRHNTDSTAGY